MSKVLLCILSLFMALAAAAGPLSAQEPAPSPEELTLRPGDTITWKPTVMHRLRFGGTAGAVTLTPFADVQKILENISPTLVVSGETATAELGVQVTATVKSDAHTSGVPEFVFTCGVPVHSAAMVTVPFKIAPSDGQPKRDVQIITANGPLRWILVGQNKKLTKQP